MEDLSPGEIVFCVMSKEANNEPGRRLAAAIGLAIPQKVGYYGYLSEHHSLGQTEKNAGDYAEDLAAEMLASTLGIEFDVDSDYDEKRDIFRMDGRIVNTRNTIAFSTVDEKGRWTTVLAAAVFVP